MNKDILPAVSDFIEDLSRAYNQKKQTGLALDMKYEEELIKELSALCGQLYEKKLTLESSMEKKDRFDDFSEEARFFRDVIFAGMNDIRQTVDVLEDKTRSSVWPYPTYGAILFSVK